MLDALGYQQVDVLSASLGGVIAQQLAHQASHRVRRLVLAATGPGLGGIPGSPRALLAPATPRRYHQPGHHQRIAARTYGGAARRDPDSPPSALAAESAAGPVAARLPRPDLRHQRLPNGRWCSTWALHGPHFPPFGDGVVGCRPSAILRASAASRAAASASSTA